MTFLTYKRHEANLQERFGTIAISVEPIGPVDMYYTDGDACRSIFKVVIDQIITVYMPQMVYRVSDEHKVILKEWMAYVEEKEKQR
jgi:hypothetical protein